MPPPNLRTSVKIMVKSLYDYVREQWKKPDTSFKSPWDIRQNRDILLFVQG